jgi:hypothetical protein
MMNARWKCPTCNAGVIAPTKPRKNDVRRYCLPCSAKAGVLVERSAPALEKKREAKKETTKKKTTAKRATISKNNAPAKEQARIDAQRVKMIHKEAERIWRLMQPYHNGRPLPRIKIVRGQNRGRQYGHAMSFINLIQVNVDLDQTIHRSRRVWQVLAHELAHCAVPPKATANGKRDVHSKEFYQCLREVWQKRWKCSISFFKVSTWGYSVDYIIQNQATHLIDWVLPTREKTTTQWED